MFDDWAIVMLGCALIVSITGCIAIILLEGSTELAATGLGALTTLLAGALVWRVRNLNGKDNHGSSNQR